MKHPTTKFIYSALNLNHFGGKAAKRSNKWIVHAHECASPITVEPVGILFSDLEESINWKRCPVSNGRAYIKAFDSQHPKRFGFTLVTKAEKIEASEPEMQLGQAYKLTLLARVFNEWAVYSNDLVTREVFAVLVLNPQKPSSQNIGRPIFRVYDNEHIAAVQGFLQKVDSL